MIESARVPGLWAAWILDYREQLREEGTGDHPERAVWSARAVEARYAAHDQPGASSPRGVPSASCVGEALAGRTERRRMEAERLRSDSVGYELEFMGGLLRWLEIDGTGLDGLCSIYQGHQFYQKDTYV